LCVAAGDFALDTRFFGSAVGFSASAPVVFFVLVAMFMLLRFVATQLTLCVFFVGFLYTAWCRSGLPAT
jgi:hypothetical protein